MPTLSPEMRACIQACQSCHATCLETVPYCLQKGGKHAAADHIRLLLDCVEICQTSAGFMLRGSDLHPRTCSLCAEVCEQCATDCEQMVEDKRMRRCAEACHQYAESCRQMASG